MKRQPALSDQLRKAITASNLSRYAIAKQAGIDQAVLSRFLAGKAGMSIETIDAIGRVLALRLVSDEVLSALKRTRKSSTPRET